MTLPKSELAYDRAPAACLRLLSEVDMIAVGIVFDVYLLTGINLSTPSAASVRRPSYRTLQHYTRYSPTSAWIQRRDRLRSNLGMVGWCFGLKVLAGIFPRLNCDVFFMNIESRTKLIGKLLGILLLLKEH